MLRKDKERIVAELVERLRNADTLIVTDYRGLSVSDFDELRTRLLEAGARISVVKNTLTRLAVEQAGTDQLLDYLEGPSAIAFIQPDGDPVAVAKVLSETARTSRVLVIKGGLFAGRPISDAVVEDLAKLPPADVLRGQVLGAIVAPLNAIMGLVTAPLQDLYGLLDARITQVGDQAEAPIEEGSPEASAAEDATEESPSEEVANATSEEKEESDGSESG